MSHRSKLLGISLATMTGLSLGACEKGDDVDNASPEQNSGDTAGDQGTPLSGHGPRVFYGLDDRNTLVRFSLDNPGHADKIPIGGLSCCDERMLGIDFRPADGLLYGVSTYNIVYRINADTGAAAALGPAFTPELAGGNFGVDFNPVPDRIRTHSDADQNLRLNPTNGALAGIDGVLTYVASDVNAGVSPTIGGSAYTNGAFGQAAPPASTSLYVINSRTNELGLLPTPNDGVITTVGPLDVETGPELGFDIAGDTNEAFAALSDCYGQSSLYVIDLTSGHADCGGEIGHHRSLIGLTVAPASAAPDYPQ